MFLPNILILLLLFMTGAQTVGAVHMDSETITAHFTGPIYLKFDSKRATDEEFSTEVDQMRMIARVANGIHLQQGFFKGTIPADELICELLNINIDTLNAINAIDTNKLKGVGEKFQNLVENLVSGNSSVEMEGKLKLIFSIVDGASGLGKLESPGDAYLQEVTKLKGEEDAVWASMENYVKSLSTFLRLEAIEENANRIFPDLKNAAFVLTKKMFGKGKPPSFDVVLQKEKNVNNLRTFHASATSYSNGKSKLSYDDKKDSKRVGEVATNIQSIGSTIGEVKSSETDLKMMNQIFAVPHHHHRGNRILTHLPAFAFGASELQLIVNDLKNPFVERVVGAYVGDLLKTLSSLNPVANLGQEAEAFTGRSDEKALQGVSLILSRIAEVSQLQVDYNGMAATLSSILTTAVQPNLVPTNLDKYGTLQESMSILLQQSIALREIIKASDPLSSAQFKTKLKNIEKIAEYDDHSEIAALFKTLKQSQDFKDVIAVLTPIKSHVEFLVSRGDNGVFKSTDTIVSNWKEMDTFIKNSTNFYSMLDKLRKISGFKSVVKLIEIRENLSGDGKPGKVELNPMIGNINGLKNKTKKLNELIPTFKGSNTDAMDALMQAGDLKDPSRTLGPSTHALVLMKNGVEEKITSDFLTKVSPAILLEMKKNNLAAEEIAILNGFQKLQNQVETWLNNLAYLVHTFKPTSSANLVGYGDIFEKAKSVKGIEYDLVSFVAALAKLESNSVDVVNKNSLKSAIGKIQQLQDLGVNYSPFAGALEVSKDALNEMDLFFSRYTQLLAPTTPLPAGQKRPPSSSGSGNEGSVSGQDGGIGEWIETTTAALKYYQEPWFFVVAALGTIALFVAIGFGVWWCCFKGKKEPVPEPIPPRPPVPDASVVPVITPLNQSSSASASGKAANDQLRALEAGQEKGKKGPPAPAGPPHQDVPNKQQQEVARPDAPVEAPNPGTRQDYKGTDFGLDYACEYGVMTNAKEMLNEITDGIRNDGPLGYSRALMRHMNDQVPPEKLDAVLEQKNEERMKKPDYFYFGTRFYNFAGENFFSGAGSESAVSGVHYVWLLQPPRNDEIIARMYRMYLVKRITTMYLLNNYVEGDHVINPYFNLAPGVPAHYDEITVTSAAPTMILGCVEVRTLTVEDTRRRWEKLVVTHYHVKDLNRQEYPTRDQLLAFASLINRAMRSNDRSFLFICHDGRTYSAIAAYVRYVWMTIHLNGRPYKWDGVVVHLRRVGSSGSMPDDKRLLLGNLMLAEMVASANPENAEFRRRADEMWERYNRFLVENGCQTQFDLRPRLDVAPPPQPKNAANPPQAPPPQNPADAAPPKQKSTNRSEKSKKAHNVAKRV